MNFRTLRKSSLVVDLLWLPFWENGFYIIPIHEKQFHDTEFWASVYAVECIVQMRKEVYFPGGPGNDESTILELCDTEFGR